MKKFELELKNEKQGLYKRITLIILFINFIFFIYGATITTNPDQKKWFVFGAVVILVTSVFDWYRTRRSPVLIQDAYSGIYIAVVFAWVILKNYWLATAHLILMILFIKANRGKLIQFMPSHIYIQGWPDKKIQWNSVSNIILKDGILTIDFKNNKLMQAKVVDSWTKIEEQSLNQFCYDQINIKFYTTDMK